MADTADLIVLGAYYGTGNKGHHHSNTMYSSKQKPVSLMLCSKSSDFTRRVFFRGDDVSVPDGRVRQVM